MYDKSEVMWMMHGRNTEINRKWIRWNQEFANRGYVPDWAGVWIRKIVHIDAGSRASEGNVIYQHPYLDWSLLVYKCPCRWVHSRTVPNNQLRPSHNSLPWIGATGIHALWH